AAPGDQKQADIEQFEKLVVIGHGDKENGDRHKTEQQQRGDGDGGQHQSQTLVQALAGPKQGVDQIEHRGADQQRGQKKERQLEGRADSLAQAVGRPQQGPVEQQQPDAAPQHSPQLRTQLDALAQLGQELGPVPQQRFDND